ncbi:hypothetical protein ACHAWO_005849 [Cyclotella atomus]|uniref:EamA domain-containing protein n=1 Tax=Cyclotella atomus TaxID=382360 RepID=A0ABD3Q7E1_9STRA
MSNSKSTESSREHEVATAAGAGLLEKMKNSHIGPRSLLMLSSILYASSYPLIAVMNNSYPPSFTTMARMILAFIPLLPFLPQLDRNLRFMSIFSGCFEAAAHITLSLALVHTSPPRASFLGCLTVIICPIMDAVFDGRDLSLCKAPQVWLAAALSLAGVAVLELYSSSEDDTEDIITSYANEMLGDGLAVLSALAMSVCFYTTEKMLKDSTNQVLPIIAVQVGVSAVISTVWCVVERWALHSWTQSYNLPGSLFQQAMLPATFAILWSGLISTDLNFLLETTALEKVTSSKAAVILATEPLWVALFCFFYFRDSFDVDDLVGGILVVLACVVSGWEPLESDDVTGSHNTEPLIPPTEG